MRTRRAAASRAEPNGGLSSARNYGLEHARGEFVAFLDCDDALMPNYLEALLARSGRRQRPARVQRRVGVRRPHEAGEKCHGYGDGGAAHATAIRPKRLPN